METISSAQSEPLMALLAQHIEHHRAELVDRYLGILRESLFASRAELRPSALKSFAADEVEALLQFLRQARSPGAVRGEQLHQAGFNVRAILKLSQITRQFLLDALEDHQVGSMLEVVDAYEMEVVQGFIQSIDNTNKIERGQLERVLTALQQRGDK